MDASKRHGADWLDKLVSQASASATRPKDSVTALELSKRSGIPERTARDILKRRFDSKELDRVIYNKDGHCVWAYFPRRRSKKPVP
jgi:predicted transcriptional regulator